MQVNEAALDNALVDQKNHMLAEIADAMLADDLDSCIAMLKLFAPVWHAVGYGYKVEEVMERIRVRASFLNAEIQGSRSRFNGFERQRLGKMTVASI